MATSDKKSELMYSNEAFDEAIPQVWDRNAHESVKKQSTMKKGNNCSMILLTLALIALAICLAGVAIIAVMSLAEVRQLEELLKEHQEMIVKDPKFESAGLVALKQRLNESQDATNKAQESTWEKVFYQIEAIQTRVKKLEVKVRNISFNFKNEIADSIGFAQMERNRIENSLQNRMSNEQSQNTQQFTEISQNFSTAQTSRDQLQATIDTNNNSFLARASQIESTVSTTLQSIQDQIARIESNVTTNHQSWLSRATQIEISVYTNRQEVLDQINMIQSNVTTSRQNWLFRAAQIENTVNTNQQSTLDRLILVECNVTAIYQSWLSRAAKIENTVELHYQNLSSATDMINSRISSTFRTFQQIANVDRAELIKLTGQVNDTVSELHLFKEDVAENFSSMQNKSYRIEKELSMKLSHVELLYEQSRSEISQNFSVVESSQEFLLTTINTSHSSFLVQINRIQKTVNTNQRDILDQVTQIENNVTVNHQHCLSRATQTENTVNDIHQNISDQVNQIMSNVTTNHQGWLSRTAQLENTFNINQQSILDRVAQIENNITTNLQSLVSRVSSIEKMVNLTYHGLSNKYDYLENLTALTLQQQANSIENTVTSNYSNIINSRGVTYIRWGHNACPTGRTTIYTGRVGGSAYNHRGGASNQVCLPEDPQYYSSFQSGSQRYSTIYGSEYEVPLSSNAATNDNVPCAVCSVTTRQQMLMIPAKYSCPSGWTREYNGFFMAEHTSNYRSTFICVDKSQTPIRNTRGHNYATDLYHVEADCSNLPCGPYSSEKELSCVVCSK